jgi:hypothetical protein
MTLPKKGTRTIEIDSMRFRYVISRSATLEFGLFSLNLTVQIESGRGRILKAEGIVTRDYWLDCPKTESADKYMIMKPGHVAAVIRRARTCGWDPEGNGTPFHLTVTSSEFQ